MVMTLVGSCYLEFFYEIHVRLQTPSTTHSPDGSIRNPFQIPWNAWNPFVYPESHNESTNAERSLPQNPTPPLASFAPSIQWETY